MNEHNLVIVLLVLLLVSKVIGEILEHFGQMAMIGEILAGIILGPTVLGFIKPGPPLQMLSDLGVFMMVMLAGMELDFSDIRDAFRGRGRWIPLINFFFPFGVGILVALALGFAHLQAVLLGLCISITALPVAVRILMELGWMQTNIAKSIVSAAVLDDTMALLIVGVLMGARNQGDVLLPILITAGKAAGFVAAVIFVHWLVGYHIPHSRRVVYWMDEHLKGKEALFAVTLVFVLGFGSISELIGLHFVVGAFFGSMVLSRRVLGRIRFEELQKRASGAAMGFLAPIFFAAMGVQFQAMGMHPLVVIAVLLTGFVTKVAGGYAGGRLAGLSSGESLVMGFGLNGRGIMELVIANLALSLGLIDKPLFSTLVLMGVVTTMATPVLLKWAFRRAHPEKAEPPAMALEPLPAVDLTHPEAEAPTTGNQAA